jgi:hypothetical protein
MGGMERSSCLDSFSQLVELDALELAEAREMQRTKA